ncbi:MAG: hypothetical protein NVSMB56_05310 [Pyrinomonadaceae bacterium]
MRILARFQGARLDRLQCRHAWLNRPSLVMLGEHVTLGGESDAETELDVKNARDKRATGKAGTGCVHTAPGHGHDDFVIGKQYGLEIYCPVDNAGRFTSDVEHFAGEQVFKANPHIIEFMREQGCLVFNEDYTHRYAHCWRCKNPVIFRATPQWFISLDATAQDATHDERDEDGRAVTNFVENETDAPRSLRQGALAEIERVKWIPGWGRERMRNMLKGRPDWCVSRQRLWGVPIPAFYCVECDELIADVSVVNHVASIFEKESSDAWYARAAKDLLPEGFKCPKCGAQEFTKESDILDVWFDSGTSSIAVLEGYQELSYPADVYLEGGDQYRGWFNSSLMVGLAAHDVAPYRTVVTHGWVVDGQGKAMHKSTGNSVSPNDVIKQSGAEILRLWSASTDYHEDMRCSNEILQRVTDGYRKLRNTARFALGNLDGFDPSSHTVNYEEMQEMDRWVLAELDKTIEVVKHWYRDYSFYNVYHALYDFCIVTLSARYFDMIKDVLYLTAPNNIKRRSAQTALYRIADSLARMLAPILVFTADEIWENLPPLSTGGSRFPSVHLAEFPEANNKSDREQLIDDWHLLFFLRDQALAKLEKARSENLIGSSLRASLIIDPRQNSHRDVLEKYKDILRYFFIVSNVRFDKIEGGSLLLTQFKVELAEGEKCERCWNYSTRVGESSRYPTVCERCVEALQEIESAES